MALTAVITKVFPRKLNPHDFTIEIHAAITDETAEVLLEKNYSTRWYSAISLDSIKAKLQEQFKADWDKYIDEKAKYDAVQFDTLVSEIQTAANNYINQ